MKNQTITGLFTKASKIAFFLWSMKFVILGVIAAILLFAWIAGIEKSCAFDKANEHGVNADNHAANRANLEAERKRIEREEKQKSARYKSQGEIYNANITNSLNNLNNLNSNSNERVTGAELDADARRYQNRNTNPGTW